jgi:hypothetical protein
MHPVWWFLLKPKSAISQHEWSPGLAPVYKLLTLLFLTVPSTISLPSVNSCMCWLAGSLSCTFKAWNPFMRSDSIGGTATHFLNIHFMTIVVWNRHFFQITWHISEEYAEFICKIRFWGVSFHLGYSCLHSLGPESLKKRKSPGSTAHGWENYLKWPSRQRVEIVDLTHLAQYREQWQVVMHTIMRL